MFYPVDLRPRYDAAEQPPKRRRISSRFTFFLKRIAPTAAFGSALLHPAIVFSAFVEELPPLAWFFVLGGVSVGVCVFGWLTRDVVIFDLADEIIDEGDSLLVRKENREERIHLSNLDSVRCNIFFFPDKVTLILKKPSGFGQEIAFLQRLFIPHFKSPIIQDLIDRIDAKRAD